MRILYIPSWYPSHKNPGAGSFIKELAIDLNENDIEIEVAAFHYDYKNLSLKEYEINNENGIIEHHFNGWVAPKMNTFLQTKWVATCLKNLYNNIDLTGIDFIHAHDYVSYFLAYDLSIKSKIPVIATMHHSDIMMDLIPDWRKKLLLETLSHCKEIIVPSKALQTALKKYFNVNSLIIPNYIDSSKIKNKNKLGLGPNKLISVSSLEPLKQVSISIEYMKQYEGTLDIYGEGPLKNKLLKLIEKHNLKNKINLKGSLPHEELLQRYCEYDALISTSSYETFGLSILEAIAAGIPVIVSNKYGPKDFITKENGVFIDDINDIKSFSDNYNKYSTQNIRNTVIPKYDKPMIINKYIAFYRKLYTSLCVA